MAVDVTVPRTRRAVIAGAIGGTVAVAASALGRVDPVLAGSDGDVVLGATNTEATPTIIQNLVNDQKVLDCLSKEGDAIQAWVFAAGKSGVYATSNSATGQGVLGRNSTNENRGYLGGGSFGVSGTSSTGDGVRGASWASGKSGVYGVNSVTGGYGVFGRNSASGNTGALGASDAGVRGDSTSGVGVNGALLGEAAAPRASASTAAAPPASASTAAVPRASACTATATPPASRPSLAIPTAAAPVFRVSRDQTRSRQPPPRPGSTATRSRTRPQPGYGASRPSAAGWSAWPRAATECGPQRRPAPASMRLHPPATPFGPRPGQGRHGVRGGDDRRGQHLRPGDPGPGRDDASFVLLTPKADIGTRRLWYTTDATANTITIRVSSAVSASLAVGWLLLG